MSNIDPCAKTEYRTSEPHEDASVRHIRSDINELRENVKDLKDCLLDPDDGIYARIKGVDGKLDQYKDLLGVFSKAIWIFAGIFITAVAGLIMKKIGLM